MHSGRPGLVKLFAVWSADVLLMFDGRISRDAILARVDPLVDWADG